MRLRFILLGSGLLVASCTAPEIEYCRSTGVDPGSPEYDRCLNYYFQQERAFKTDLGYCSAEADRTYPPTLYSGWGTAMVHGGYGYGGKWHSGEMLEVPPDYQHNAQLDALRGRIVAPCMQSRGWNSGAGWQAGRHAVGPASNSGLPWQYK